jgi:hypothetical protein
MFEHKVDVRENLGSVDRLNDVRGKVLYGSTDAQSLYLTREPSHLMFTQLSIEETS